MTESIIEIDFKSNIVKKNGVEIDPLSIDLVDEKETTWLNGNVVIKSYRQGRPHGDFYRAVNYFHITSKTKCESSPTSGSPYAPQKKKKGLIRKIKSTPKVIERECVEYTPIHKYRFEIVNDAAHLYIDDVEMEITEDNIVKIEAFEMYFGVLPSVVEFIHPYMKEEVFISSPPIFRKDRVPKIYTDGTRSTIGNTTISLLMLLLFYKKVVRSEFVQVISRTFYLEKSKDPAHCFRSHTDKSLLNILQSSKGNFKSHGYTEKYTDGSYCFFDYMTPRSVEIADRTKRLSKEEFDVIKLAENNCCSICGSQESDSVKLEQGHIDPHKPLTAPGNCAPHCESCNQTNRDNITIKEYINPLKKRKLAYFTQHNYVRSLFTPEEFFEIVKKDTEKTYLGYTIKLEKQPIN